ncbi:MAG: hypothetical protein GWN84_01425 [Gammaproteobacteria bacterium]|nr:hypothetical protein [Gammaproteobacteria bacterium]NIR81821.1 hypothetical protein [Gammaproteobacteria bacterium]NIR88653.1 hypothetical protein [Gammaproteobacteria bacterium]NIU02929.1 hypothetical protein [Gammaproteobacteria bacterium]NIV50450.1 hypothetical protein [Gammaproteobacteria bacterium]
MKQQVNLYQPIFRRERRVFSARAMLASVGMVLVGLLLIYGYARWQMYELRVELGRLDAQRRAATERLTGLDGVIPARAKSQLLEAEIARLEHELARKRRVAAALEAGVLGNTRGFSSYLTGLARQRVDGLWLTGLRISEGGERLIVSGRALSPERVPMLVQRLAGESAFVGLHFNTLQMERAGGGEGTGIEFVLGTVEGEE